jgi:hypothetical protein
MNFPTDNNKSPVNRLVQFSNVLHTVRNIARWLIVFFTFTEADRLNAGIYVGIKRRNE